MTCDELLKKLKNIKPTIGLIMIWDSCRCLVFYLFFKQLDNFI